MPQPGVADEYSKSAQNEAGQPERAGRRGMVSNLLLLVLWFGWCVECTGWFIRNKRVLGDYRTQLVAGFYVACAGLIASKLAPTGLGVEHKLGKRHQSLWERACSRWGHS
jgi:hypothetical protein